MGAVTELFADRIDREIKGAKCPVEAYLGRLAPGSRRTMRQSLRYMAQEFSGGQHSEHTFEWAGLRYDHTIRMRNSLGQRYAPATANKMLSALRGVLTECWRLGQMGVEELARAKDIQPITGKMLLKGRCLSRNEINLVLMHVGNPRHRDMLRLMFATGLRRGEVSALRFRDFTLDGITVLGKGGKQRIVPVPYSVLQPVIKPFPPDTTDPNARVFEVSPGRIWHICREAAFSAGLPPLSPHDLRRTYATTMLAAGKDLSTVQRLMGHSNPKTTAGYDRRGAEDDAKAVEDVWGSL